MQGKKASFSCPSPDAASGALLRKPFHGLCCSASFFSWGLLFLERPARRSLARCLHRSSPSAATHRESIPHFLCQQQQQQHTEPGRGVRGGSPAPAEEGSCWAGQAGKRPGSPRPVTEEAPGLQAAQATSPARLCKRPVRVRERRVFFLSFSLSPFRGVPLCSSHAEGYGRSLKAQPSSMFAAPLPQRVGMLGRGNVSNGTAAAAAAASLAWGGRAAAARRRKRRGVTRRAQPPYIGLSGPRNYRLGRIEAASQRGARTSDTCLGVC